MNDWLLALHSSTETVGIALVSAQAPLSEARVLCRPMGRALTNALPSLLEEVLPTSEWPGIRRLAVATGPGGFTGTRLTVVLARTLAQQLQCPLDGLSSFALMAPRLQLELPAEQRGEPFSIVQVLPRRGRVAGRYQVRDGWNRDTATCAEMDLREWQVPVLLQSAEQPAPEVTMAVDVACDVLQLLRFCQDRHSRHASGPWDPVLPIYPTSPVGSV